jgi:hypothetical protein
MRDKPSFSTLFGKNGVTEEVPPQQDTPGDEEALPFTAMTPETWPRPANKTLPRLHIVKSDGTVFTMMYHELASHAAYKGGEFTLLFAGAKLWEVTVKGSGPEFWKCYDYITLARWPFLVEATRGFKGGDGDTVFDSIEIRDVTPKDR